MRFKIICRAENNKVPIGYRMMILSLIKKCLQETDGEYFNDIFYFNNKKNKKIKPFTFATYLNDYSYEEDFITVKGEINISISTIDYNLGILIYNGLLKLKEYEFKKEYKLIVQKVILEREKQINENKILLKTLSPIYIRNKNNKPVSIEDETYEKELNYICNLELESIRGYGLKEIIKFRPVNMKKVVVKEEIENFKEITNKKYMYIEAYKGTFTLDGNLEDLRVIVQAGVGFRRSQGFGMIDLV